MSGLMKRMWLSEPLLVTHVVTCEHPIGRGERKWRSIDLRERAIGVNEYVSGFLSDCRRCVKM